MSKPSVILLGSKPGAVVALSKMLQRGWDVRLVVTSPAFNYEWIPGPTLEQFASDKGIIVCSDQADIPQDLTADFVISYMFRHLVKENVINLASRAAVNFHAGPLPEFGGWAFYNIAILEGASEYGCTCHYMDNDFDTGPLLKVHRFPIDARSETAFSLERKAQEHMVVLFDEFCDLAETAEILPRVQQDPAKMRYLKKPEFEALKQIPPDANAETIDRHARAFWYPPYQCAYVVVNGIRVEVIPEIVKTQLASLLHADDLTRLYQAGATVNGAVEN